jgi:hypothetical protein
MTTISETTGEPVERALDEQFLELVCSDEELLRAEFDAIVSAEWPTPPNHAPAHRPSGEPPTPRGQPWSPAPGARLMNRPRHPGLGGWARQRSPPAQRHTATPEVTGPSRKQ